MVFNVRGKDFGYGYNAATKVYEDLLKAGVVDPAKVRGDSGEGFLLKVDWWWDVATER